MTIRGLQAPILTRIMQEHAPGEDRARRAVAGRAALPLAFVLVGLLVDRAGMPAPLGVLAIVFTVATLAALGAFTRAHRAAAVALDGDIRYRPKT